VTSCLKNRLEWTDLKFIRDVILFLATRGWQKLVDEESQSEQAINCLTSKFKVPLEATGVIVELIVDEFRDMLSHATQFISLSSTNYQMVWWRLFHSPNAFYWTNVQTLTRLLFSLPLSNGKLERVFSTMKNIKMEKRSLMSNETLDDLLAINVDKVNAEDFNADHSIQLWWKTKTRHPNPQPRNMYRKKQRDHDTNTGSDTDNWVDDYSD